MGFLILLMLGWQQEVHYKIKVELNEEEHILYAQEWLDYVNHSPDTLNYVWFHLYPNAYKKGSQFFKELQKWRKLKIDPEKEGYIEIDTLFANEMIPDSSRVIDTEMWIKFKKPILPGDTGRFYFRFKVKIPPIWSRLGHVGDHYEITQWYPKIVVYDTVKPIDLDTVENIKGKSGYWHPDGYHRVGEFYGEYGSFDVEITVPAGYKVAATGEVVEPFMYKNFLRGQIDSLKLEGDKWTYHFVANNVHDFVWIASKRFRVSHGKYKNTEIFVFYFPEDSALWKGMVKEVEKILAKYEEWYMPYEYSSLSVVEGYLRAGGGMEYPNLVIISRYRTSIPFISVFFNSGKMKRMALIDVISHEIGHQWFYAMVGNNEMDYPWLDEGFTTFTEIRYMKWRFPEDSVRSYLNFFGRLFHFKGGYGDFTKPWLYYLMDRAEEPLVGKKAYELKNYFFAIYMKGSLVLNALKDLMGEEKFNDLMKEYVRKFKFRHPVPQDFVRLAVERDSSLKYFFDFWLHEKEFPDFYCKRDKGRLKIGESHGRKLPVKISVDDSTFVALLPVEIEGKRGKVDPENVVVEKREWNNLIPRKVKFNPNVVFPDMEATNLWALPFGLYDRFNGWKPGIYFGAMQFRGARFSFVADYGLKSKKLMHYLAFKKNIPLGEMTINGGDFNGLREIRGSVSQKGRYISLFHQDLYLLENFDKSFYEKSWKAGITAELWRSLRILPVRNRGGLGVTVVLEDGEPYIKLSLKMNLKLGPSTLDISFRNIWGDVLPQNQFLLKGEAFHRGFLPFILPHKGSFSPLSEAISVGEGLASFTSPQLRGKRRLLIMFTPVSLKIFKAFVNAGWIGEHIVLDKSYIEAGGKLDFGKVSLEFPLWTKEPGQKGDLTLRFVMRVNM